MTRLILVILTLMVPLLTACTHDKPYSDAALNAPATGDTFRDKLRTGYVNLADNEWKGRDTSDAKMYGKKALTVVQGVTPPLDDLTHRNLPVDKLNELATERNYLVSAFARGVHVDAPDPAARAQLMFDCWVEQEEDPSKAKRLGISCRDEFFKVKQEIVQILEQRHVEDDTADQAEQKRLQQKALSLEEQLALERRKLRRMPEPYIVFFPLDSTALNLSGKKTLEKVAQEISIFKPAKVIVSGHTDRSGNAEYNMQLSRKRAQAMKDFMAGLGLTGVTEKLLDLRFYGENGPQVDTQDNIAEQQNRYGQVIFLKDNRTYMIER